MKLILTLLVKMRDNYMSKIGESDKVFKRN